MKKHISVTFLWILLINVWKKINKGRNKPWIGKVDWLRGHCNVYYDYQVPAAGVGPMWPYVMACAGEHSMIHSISIQTTRPYPIRSSSFRSKHRKFKKKKNSQPNVDRLTMLNGIDNAPRLLSIQLRFVYWTASLFGARNRDDLFFPVLFPLSFIFFSF